MGEFAKTLRRTDVPDSGTGRDQIEYIDIGLLDDDPNNFYELSGVDELAANIEMFGLQQPIRVRQGENGRYVIVSGHRRRAAVRQLVDGGREDLREVPCIREKAAGSPALQELRLIYANSDTRRMSSAEISKQAERVESLLYQLKEEGYDFPGRMRDHVAEACKVSKSKLARLKMIRDNLIPPLKKVWEKGKMNEAVAYACAQHSADIQKKLIAYSKQCQYYTTPDRWYESTVNDRTRTLERESSLKCNMGAPGGLCDNTAKRLEMLGAGASWNENCSKGGCCSGCPSLATCRHACPHLADEIKWDRAERKVQRAKEAAERVKRDRPKTKPITALWKRFAEARQAADLSMDEYLAAAKIYTDSKVKKRYEAHERGEKITRDTGLPYCGGMGFPLHEIQYLKKAADVLGVSIDYLLCRTNDPHPVSPQEEGQLCISAWMPCGGTNPGPEPGWCAVLMDLGKPELHAKVLWWDGSKWLFRANGPGAGLLPVWWMRLPPDPADEEAGS